MASCSLGAYINGGGLLAKNNSHVCVLLVLASNHKECVCLTGDEFEM
jgi:hypothetical protein